MVEISALTGTGASGNNYDVQNTKDIEAKAIETAQNEAVETEDMEEMEVSQQEEDFGTNVDTEI